MRTAKLQNFLIQDKTFCGDTCWFLCCMSCSCFVMLLVLPSYCWNVLLVLLCTACWLLALNLSFTSINLWKKVTFPQLYLRPLAGCLSCWLKQNESIRVHSEMTFKAVLYQAVPSSRKPWPYLSTSQQAARSGWVLSMVFGNCKNRGIGRDKALAVHFTLAALAAVAFAQGAAFFQASWHCASEKSHEDEVSRFPCKWG